MTKWSIFQDSLTFLYAYGPNSRVQTHEANTDRTIRKNRQIHYNSWTNWYIKEEGKTARM